MTERTTEEIVGRQLEIDVLEARAAVAQVLVGDDPMGERLGEALERMIGCVMARWWFERGRKATLTTADAKDAETRRMTRVQALAHCLATIEAKSGAIDARTTQISVLSLQCETAALWGALVRAGIVTVNLKQDYLDGGVSDLMDRVQNYSQKILVANPDGKIKSA